MTDWVAELRAQAIAAATPMQPEDIDPTYYLEQRARFLAERQRGDLLIEHQRIIVQTMEALMQREDDASHLAVIAYAKQARANLLVFDQVNERLETVEDWLRMHDRDWLRSIGLDQR